MSKKHTCTISLSILLLLCYTLWQTNNGDKCTHSNTTHSHTKTLSTLKWKGLRINEVQVVGTHDSQHQRGVLSFFVPSWFYSMPPLTHQLAMGVRSLELDVHWWGMDHSFHTYHTFGDAYTSCSCLYTCLKEINDWSLAEKNHSLVTIFFDPKVELVDWCKGRTNIQQHNTLNEIVQSVFGSSRLLLPTDIQGNYTSLRASVRSRGWPSVDSTKNKLMFVWIWDDGGCKLTNSTIFFLRKHLYWNTRSRKYITMGEIETSPKYKNIVVYEVNDNSLLTSAILISNLLHANYIIRDSSTIDFTNDDYAVTNMYMQNALKLRTQIIVTNHPNIFFLNN